MTLCATSSCTCVTSIQMLSDVPAAQMFQPSASSQSDKEAMEIKSAHECHSTVLSCFIGG